jgi:hypothetical protein
MNFGGYGGASPRPAAAVAYLAASGGSVVGDTATGGIATCTAPAGVAIVKGETPAADWALVTVSAGGTRKVAVQVIHDLPHLVVESVLGIDDGRWATLAGGGAPDRSHPGQVIARAAVDAVVNRWRRGPDTPDGVRDRLRARAKGETWLAGRIADLADALDDAEIRAARDGVQAACRQWARLPVGGALRLTWPLLPA